VIVVGSGPSGALAAFECAKGGLQTLLLDRQDFPRFKVCGGCLNRVALAHLAAVGLDELPADLGAEPINRFRLAAKGAEASIALPGGMALSRRRLDAGLVRAAIRAGARFLPRTSATDSGSELPHRILLLKSGQSSGLVRARLVLAADGLRGRFTEGLTQIASVTGTDAYIGLGTCLNEQNDYPSGIIHMATHRHGYVGLVRVENGLLNLAGALDRRWLHRAGSPAEAIGEVLADVGWPIPGELAMARFQGTPCLNTFRSPVAVERVFLIGDAAGYWEPFTGEGMAWALLGGRAAASLACSALDSDACDEMTARWREIYNAVVAKRQWTCGLLTRWLRRPLLVSLGVRILAVAPILSRPLVNVLNSTSDRSISLTK
jgi:flavin-dependent dehydrogenase